MSEPQRGDTTVVELRSDTFTLPTDSMMAAMTGATLGDDVYGEDDAVNALERQAAALVGKESALFLPSGTMANLTALLSHVPRGRSIVVGDESDIYIYEARGASVLGGIAYELVPTQADGRLSVADLAAAFPEDREDPQFVLPGLICIENTHNRSGGVPLPLSYISEVRELADTREVGLHMDGARLFNAAVALDEDPARICRDVDSVQFCLSKGLGAPVGSMLAGSTALVETARRWRKMLGGGMRQAGLLAAAGAVALRDYPRLAEDHRRAALLADLIGRIDGVTLVNPRPGSNILLFRVDDNLLTPGAVVEQLRVRGVGVTEFGHGRVRAVTHSGVDDGDVERAAEALADVVSEAAASRRA